MKNTCSYRMSAHVFGIGIWRIALLLLTCLSFSPETRAQNIQHNNDAVDMGMRNTRRVNPITLGAEIQIPLGSYRGRGGLDVPVVLSYSSKLWEMKFQGYNPGAPPPHFTIEPYTIISAEYARRSVRGWTTTVGMPVLDFSVGDRIYSPDGVPNITGNCTSGCYKIDRMMVWMPDGSGHELRASDQPRPIAQAVPDNYYAVDGSRMRWEQSTQTLYMPDGSRYRMGLGKYIDRNGNTLSSEGGFRDTLDRLIPSPLPFGQGSGPSSPFDQSYSIPGVGGPTLNYTLKWRLMSDVLTTPEPVRYIANSGCPMGNGTFSPNLFATDFSGRTCIGNAGVTFNPVVLHQIVLPNGQTYTFTYDIYGAITRMVLPTGAYEKFLQTQFNPISNSSTFKPVYAQANRGVTLHVVSPTGLVADEKEWDYDGNGVTGFMTMTAPDDSRTETYVWTEGLSGWSYSADSSRAGRPYDERTYSHTGQMIRRKLTVWAMTGSNSSGNPGGEAANRNARITKEIEFILDTHGGPALAKTTTYGYDLTFQFSVGIERTSVNEFAYLDVDPNTAQTLAISSAATFSTGTLLRTTETDFLTTDVNYRSRNILGFPTATRVKNASSTVMAQSSNTYDGKTLLTYDSVFGWTDPATPFRGNVTSTSQWVNFNGTSFFTFPAGLYLVMGTQYDQCGSPRKLWDARDTTQVNPTLIDYSETFHRAYPTTNTTADPDGAGPLSALQTTTEYDLSTGSMLATVDPNLQRTEFGYNDPLNRMKQVIRAATDPVAKTQMTYNYNDSARTVTVTTDVTTYNDNALRKVILYDELGRLKETRVFEDAVNYVSTIQEYDDFGRIQRKSNPHRPLQPESPVWTTYAYDDLSREISVTTPDNAVVSTAYSGNRVLVTEQNQRQRISKTDALDRLLEVWEVTPSDNATEPVSFPNNPGITAGYLTKYQYDLLGNLTSATQRIGASGTTQTRTFGYDSASRLISAINPENGTLNYRYDNNGNITDRIDSRVPVVTVTYVYDNLNRITSRTYSDGTSTATYVYDASTVSNAKGRLTSISSSVSSYSYGGYDALGRIKTGKQTTDGQEYLIEYTYDLAGNLKTQKYPSGRIVQMEYDNANRLAGVRNQGGSFYAGGLATDAPNRIQYHAHGAISQVKLGNGLWEHMNFNLRLQPTQIGLGTASTNSSVLQLDYGYGTTTNNGNLQSHTMTMPGLTLTQNYTYDALNRLETATENGGSSWKQKFLYDRYGNRNIDTNTLYTSSDLVGPNPVLSKLTNRIAPQAGEQYQYDGAGNLIRNRDGETYTFDGENKMITFNGGAAQGGANYSYDGDGRRVKKVFGSVTTVFVYNAMGQMLAEYSSGPAPAGGTSYLTNDNLGSPRVITDGSGGVKARHDYHPFGEEIGLRGGRNAETLKYVEDTVHQKFTGKERDNETELDYFEARYYSSAHGRFIAVDPLAGSMIVSDPQTFNRFTYVLNNPLRYVDPDGLDPFDPWASLTEQERRQLTYKLTDVKPGQPGPSADEMKAAGEKFNKMVTVLDKNGKVNEDATRTNVASVQNFVASIGGTTAWNEIVSIDKVNPQGTGNQSSINFTVSSNVLFFRELQTIKDFWGEPRFWFLGDSEDGHQDSTREINYAVGWAAAHFGRDGATPQNLGVHWDPTSPYTHRTLKETLLDINPSTLMRRPAAGVAHWVRSAKVSDVRAQIKYVTTGK
jgi:RHS repeat-associated protein